MYVFMYNFMCADVCDDCLIVVRNPESFRRANSIFAHETRGSLSPNAKFIGSLSQPKQKHSQILSVLERVNTELVAKRKYQIIKNKYTPSR